MRRPVSFWLTLISLGLFALAIPGAKAPQPRMKTGLMLATRRRKFRPPVVSRLTLAWLSACGLLLGLGGVFIYAVSSDQGPGRIALALEDIEIFARPADPASVTDDHIASATPGLRLGPPTLRDDASIREERFDSEMGIETNDSLTIPDQFAGMDPAASNQPLDEIVITINGGGPPVTPPMAASLTSVPKPIPDPDPSLLRTTPLGKVPQIAADGRNALTAYAKPFDNPNDVAQIAIIVGGLGLNTTLTERAIDELPPEISLAFAPYAKNLEFWTKKARMAGHEVLIELPMEGYGDNHAGLGAAALLSTRTAEENLLRLDWLMARFGGYFGATNYMGAKLSSNADAMQPILEKLGQAGVAYIDDTGAAQNATRSSRVAWTTVNRMIPPAPDASDRNAVRRELKALETIAENDGVALGKTYAYATTIDELINWAANIDSENFINAPASAVLQSRKATR